MKREKFKFCLFVAGGTALSLKAIQSVRKIGKEQLHGRYELKIYDVYRNLDEARRQQVIATPTLVRSKPLPPMRLVGDLSDQAEVVRLLGIPETVGDEIEERASRRR